MNVNNGYIDRETVYIDRNDSYKQCEFTQCVVFVENDSLITYCKFVNCVIVGNIDSIYFNTFESCK